MIDKNNECHGLDINYELIIWNYIKKKKTQLLFLFV